jgi:hypothetical protein
MTYPTRPPLTKGGVEVQDAKGMRKKTDILNIRDETAFVVLCGEKVTCF